MLTTHTITTNLILKLFYLTFLLVMKTEKKVGKCILHYYKKKDYKKYYSIRQK